MPNRSHSRSLASLAVALLWLAAFSTTALARAPIPEGGVVSLGGSLSQTGGLVTVTATVKVAPGFHINAHEPDEPYLIPTVLRIEAGDLSFDKIDYPDPKAETFPFSPDKPMLVYEGGFEIEAIAAGSAPATAELKLRYQACDDERCLPPTSVTTVIGTPADAAAAAPAGGSGAPVGGDGSWLLEWLSGASLFTALGMTLLLGLTLNLTPCVYPLISVTLGYFGSQAESGQKTLPLACAYVLGITLSFAVLGVTASFAGGLFGSPLQHPAVLVTLAVVMVGLALSSFGLYEIRAPQALIQRFGNASGGMGGALAMGLTMGIVAAPCIGPVVLGLLVYVGSERDLLKGFLLFFSLGLGMGLPYIALASAAGSLHSLPRSGEWLRWINRFFGVLLLGMAYYFVSPLLPDAITWIAMPVFLFVAAIYLGFLEPSGKNLRGFVLVRRVTGAAVAAFALWLAVPGDELPKGIEWEPLSVPALDEAIAAQRPAVVEFGAEWCIPCVEMKRSTFVHPTVTEKSKSFSMLEADVTESSDLNDALLEHFQVVGVPTIIFFDSRGDEVERLVGFVDAKQMTELLERVS